MGADFQSFRQTLLARLDIVEVISRYVPLKRAGSLYKACCPFHNEKTPSFIVSPSRQTFHCFGCQAHGNAIDFLMQYAGLEFIDAVRQLADSVGLELPRFTGSPSPRHVEKSLAELMAQAAHFYREQLKASPAAVAYLKSRGLSGEIAARFGLGYAPEGWQALAAVFDDYGDPRLAECGLVIDSENGRRYDRFRQRIIFPIVDVRGQVIGFGGRALGDGEPKYLNSPQTPLFDKGRELYGLPQARQAIRRENTVIVVEGYMDVVALAQLGIEPVVATLGTATTSTHVQKLLRLADRVVFCFDGDNAGRKAAWRALEASLEHLSDDKTVGFAFLPIEHDPDSFVRSEGAAAFRALIEQPVRLSEFFLRGLTQHVDSTTPEGRAQLIHLATPLLQRLSAPLLRLQLVKTLAELAKMSQAEIESQCKLPRFTRARHSPPPRARVLAISPLRPLLHAVLRHPERAARLPIELIDTDSTEGRLLLAIHDAIVHGDLAAGESSRLWEYFRGSEHETVLQAELIAVEELETDEGEEEQVFIDAIARLQQQAIKAEIDALTAKARTAPLSAEEMQRYRQLLQLRAAAVTEGTH